MALFKKNIDSEKELELIATIYDFIVEATDDELSNPAYNEEYARKSIKKKEVILKALSNFDLHQYKNLVDKSLLAAAHKVKQGLVNELSAWMQQDKIATNGHLSAYAVELSIQNARSAQYQLQAGLRAFKTEMMKSAERYKAAHNGEEPSDDQLEKYSIRKTL